MKKNLLLSFLIVIGFLLKSYSNSYYVSTTGNDSNSGLESSPFGTIHYAVSISKAGDLIYVRGGVYNFTTTINITPQNNGASNNLIKLWAYPGEKPVLDFAQQTYAAASRAFFITGNYWHIKGFEIRNAGDNGMKIEGNFNIIEQCILHHCKDSGIQIGLSKDVSTNPGNVAAYNQVINCDSYNNFDPNTSGGNADGFACKLFPGPGNIFRGCRAWENSDDGWDLYMTEYQVVIESCWTWGNADPGAFGNPGNCCGNGNGFKLGGSSNSGPHIIKNSVAFDHKYSSSNNKGFDQNDNQASLTIVNCTGWGNEINFYFGSGHASSVFKNNVGFDWITKNVSIVEESQQANNSWNLPGVTASAADFMSLAEELAKAARQSDGSLPDNGFARLTSGSDLIDKGVNVGIPYNGTAPDLGAFEFNGTSPVNYTLTTSVVGQGTVAPNGGTYASGASVSLQATPASGWKFDGWSGALTGTANPVNVIMNSDKSVTATFSPVTTTKYTLTTSITGSGTISLNPAGGSYDANTVVTATATPASGWKFDGWSGAATGTANPVTIIMNSNKTLTGTFSPITSSCTWVEYQLENGTWSSGTIAETKNAGYTGVSYVNTNNATGSWFQINVSAPSAGSHNLKLRYANVGPADRPVSVSVNGATAISSLSLPSTGSWTTWVQKDFSVSLIAGTNTLRFTALTSGGAPNADRLDVCQNASSARTIQASSEANLKMEEMVIYQNYPNPMNGATTIGIWLKQNTKVKIDLCNSLGKPIAVIADKELDKGYNEINYQNSELKSGVYFYTVKTPKGTQGKQMIVK